MDLKERDALGAQADYHWYYVSKAEMVARKLPRRSERILDVGAGIGWFSRYYLRRGMAAEAVCVDPGYAGDSEEFIDGRKLSCVRKISHINANVVLMMDVLEHVDDDSTLLLQYWKLAKPGTLFVITVPAFEFLWSSHDDALEHRRRYTCARLRQTILSTGQEPDTLHYFYGTIFPIAAMIRLLRRHRASARSDLRPVPKVFNRLLTGLCRFEISLASRNRLAGLSVVATIKKV